MPKTQGERKQVTVLFADISGFTALSESLDPEQVTELVNRFFAVLNVPIEKYDGTIDKFMGDAVMVLFGAPRAHENDSERAIRCALEMRAAFDAEKRAMDGAGSLDLHVGINTGLAVAGIVGTELKREYTVIGDTVNLASRLKDQAPRGEIFISAETHRLTQRLFDFRAVGSLQVKGKSQPVPAFAVVESKAGFISTRGIEGLKSPLVGRDAERAQLFGCFETLARGRGQIVFIVGEAGLGKSRLVAEARSEVRSWKLEISDNAARSTSNFQSPTSNIVWLEGRSLSHTQNAAYFPIVEMLKRALNLRDDAAREDAARALDEWSATYFFAAERETVVPFLKYLLGLELDAAANNRLQYLDAAGLKRQTFYAIRQGLRAVARRAPTTVFIEDVHWADDASLELLRYVLPLALELPLLFVFAMRPERDHASWKLREFALSDYAARTREIALNPLTPDASNQLLANLLAIEDLPTRTRDLILARAEGNPFYVEEIVRSLIDEKLIERVQERWRATKNIDAVNLPTTLAGVIAARLDRLDPPVKETLQIGSVIGRAFPYAVLARVMPDAARLDADLARLQELALIFETREMGERQQIFKHILTQEAAYDTLLLRRRRELHGKVAHALAEYFGARLQDQIELLAYHFERSDDAANAVEYAIRAGERALARYTPQEAQKFYRVAWMRMDEEKIADEARRLRVLVGLGDAESARGESAAALAMWERGADFARALDDKESLAGLHRRMGLNMLAKGDVDAARKLYEFGLTVLPDARESRERAALVHELARLYFRIGDNANARVWAERALELGKKLSAQETIAQAYNTLGIAVARSGEIEKGIEYVEMSRAGALEHDLLGAACRAYANLGMLYAAVDHAKSIAFSNEGLALARRIGDLACESLIQSALASNWCSLQGDWEQGLAAARASIELDRVLGARSHLPVPLILLAQIYQCHRQYADSEKFYREAQAIAEEIGDPQLLFPIYDGLATLSLEKGNEAMAQSYLENSRRVAERAGYTGETLLVVPFLN